MKKISLLISALLAITSLRATPIIDGDHPPVAPLSDFGFGSSPLPYSYPFRFPSAVFQPNFSGRLAALDLWVTRRENGGDLRVQIIKLAATYGLSEILTTQIISGDGIPAYTGPNMFSESNYISVTLESNIYVSAGTTYAIVLSDLNNRSNGNEPFVWWSSYSYGPSNIYPGLIILGGLESSSVFFPIADGQYGYRTYIDPDDLPSSISSDEKNTQIRDIKRQIKHIRALRHGQRGRVSPHTRNKLRYLIKKLRSLQQGI
jgi:hypothetical protein